MDPLFVDNDREIREILERGAEGIDNGADREDATLPLEFCRGFSRSLDWELMTGFKEDTLQVIVGQALPHISCGRKNGVKRNECVMLALIWFRTGGNVRMIASKTKFSYQVCLRALFRGIKGLAACFEPFSAYGPVPALSKFLSEEEKELIPERAQESLFVVDGKHIEGKRIGTFEDARTYYSYKLNSLAYQFQCIVTHLGHCIHVSNAERAATHDMMVYRNNRPQLLAGLIQAGYRNPVILADQGYKCELPELFVPDTPCKQLNARRLIVENYFGRMTNVFRIVRMKFPFGYDMVNPFLKALCFLTNVHVFKSPLRKEEFKLHRAFVACRLKKHTEKKKKASNNSSNVQRGEESLNITNSPFTMSQLSDFETYLAKRAPPQDGEDE